MVKKLCMSGIVVAAVAGATMFTVPAYADVDTDNDSHNHSSLQSGNNFGNVVNSNVGSGRATNVNNVNGTANTAADDSNVGTYADLD
jgi:hypothetical protein